MAGGSGKWDMICVEKWAALSIVLIMLVSSCVEEDRNSEWYASMVGFASATRVVGHGDCTKDTDLGSLWLRRRDRYLRG